MVLVPGVRTSAHRRFFWEENGLIEHLRDQVCASQKVRIMGVEHRAAGLEASVWTAQTTAQMTVQMRTVARTQMAVPMQIPMTLEQPMQMAGTMAVPMVLAMAGTMKMPRAIGKGMGRYGSAKPGSGG